MARDRGGTQYAASRNFRGSMAGGRRYVKGDKSFRRLLLQLGPATRESMVQLMEEAGDEIAAAMRADSSSSRVRAAISRRVSKATLRLRVGLIGKPINRRLFFARIIEKGRKAKTVSVRRRGNKPYTMRVRAMKARPFVYNQRKVLGPAIDKRIHAFWDRALAKAGHGLSDD